MIIWNFESRLIDCYEIAQLSPDKSNQNGAIVDNDGNRIGQGYNHNYFGVPWTDERPAKYERVAHAEFDACLSLSRSPAIVEYNTVLFCPWAACKPCALAILGSGIKHLAIHAERCEAFMRTRPGQDENALIDWQPAIEESAQWMKDGGITIHVWNGPVNFAGTVLINGRPWSPSRLEFV